MTAFQNVDGEESSKCIPLGQMYSLPGEDTHI